MSDEEKYLNTRRRRETSEQAFITSTIDSLLSSHYKNQDAVLEHQTEMIRSLVESRNLTSQNDMHFFAIIDEIRTGYTSMMEDLNQRVIEPTCPEVTPVLYILVICLILSGLLNAALIYLHIKNPAVK